ncbi:hypothetical protein JCM11754A_00500 [Isoptericola variabilis]
MRDESRAAGVAGAASGIGVAGMAPPGWLVPGVRPGSPGTVHRGEESMPRVPS